MFLVRAGFAEGEKGEGDLRTVYVESFCYCKATKCGLKILGRVTKLLLPPAWVEAAQLDPALSCLGTTVQKAPHARTPTPTSPPLSLAPPPHSTPPAQEAIGPYHVGDVAMAFIGFCFLE